MRLGKLCSPTICFVAGDSFYQALPQLDTNANLVAVEAMSFACEAWERDAATVEPVGPSRRPPIDWVYLADY
jgi:hypothetical protein